VVKRERSLNDCQLRISTALGLVHRMPGSHEAVTATFMTQPVQTRRVKEALARVRVLFTDPDAKLTAAGAAQMAGLDREVCRGLLQNLVDAGFLEQRLRGVFVRSASTSH
jgi:hypothetical protein